MPDAVRPPGSNEIVPSNQIQRNWRAVSDQAPRHPVVITAKGRPRHVLMAFDEYERLKARDRQAYRIENLPPQLAALLADGLNALRVPEGASNDGGTLISRLSSSSIENIRERHDRRSDHDDAARPA